MKIRNAILRVVNARFSVSSWILALINLATALIMTLQMFDENTPNLANFLNYLPLFNGKVWTVSLVIAAVVVLVGMAKSKYGLIKYGAMASFALLAFGVSAFVMMGEAITVILLIAPLMVFLSYLYLASVFRDSAQL